MTPPWAERALLALLPARHRESIQGDAAEEIDRTSGRAVLRFYLPIIVHHQVEAYRAPEDRLGVTLLGFLALAVLWAVPAAAGGGLPDPSSLPGPFYRLLEVMWGTADLTSALAAGLLIGRVPLVPDHGAPARWHLGVAIAAVGLAAGATWGEGAGSAALLLAGLWLGDRARSAPLPGTPTSG